MKDLVILVATHKKYQMPKESIYLPLHVGREGKEDLGYQGDNTGDNISIKNPNYCELTGLYWAWKNLSCEYIGLCHYRRYFTNKNLIQRFLHRHNKFDLKFDLILTESEIKKLLEEYDVILPTKRNYYIETVWSHYENAHHIKDLEETKKIIEEKYPEYLDSFEKVMSGTKLHLYNMFIMKKEDFDRYCKWVFDILFELEKRVDISSYDNYQKRIFGFISERLFNVWVYSRKLRLKKLPVVNIEEINWGKKIANFLLRKVK
ncbi:DUF4422 domain-containing protein [Geobacillus kaustophilus]|uniref:DUF4422 domain-containing protein n=1 Tax=Geobacillus kaustophilus TaxID=1462 RepID=UPI0005CC9ABD|nr:DUF4422 domain-containing protein [Geobacillus kaustophilus]